MFTELHIVLRLVLALVLGGLIGFEREIHGRAAGLRTHILVCVGSALVMLTGMHLFMLFHEICEVDLTKLAAGIITGIGFLGAGTIIRSQTSVSGLTTAASIWTVAGIGLAVGVGFYVGAYTATALVLFVLFFLNRLERKLERYKPSEN